MTLLSRVITSFHPIESHSIHPLSADTNSTRQAGQRMWPDGGTGARRGEEDEEEGGMDGMATRQQGERKGKVVGLLGEGEGVDNPAAHHSQVCVQTLVGFLEEEKSRPPATLTSCTPHKYASVPGPPMGCRSGQWGQRNSLHINILPYSIAKQTACDGSGGDFSSFFFMWNQRGRPFDSCKGSPSLPF